MSFINNLFNRKKNGDKKPNGFSYPELEKYEQALLQARNNGDQDEEAAILTRLGNICNRLGALDKAIEYYEQALIIARDTGSLDGEVLLLNNLGMTYRSRGDTLQAIRLFERILTVMQQKGDVSGVVSALNNLGCTYRAMHDTKRALELFEQGLTIARQNNDRFGEMGALGNLATIYSGFLEDHAKGIKYLEDSLLIAREVGHRDSEKMIYNELSSVYRKSGNLQQAIHWQKGCIGIAQEEQDVFYAAKASFDLAMMLAQQHWDYEASRYAEYAKDVFEQIGRAENLQETQQFIKLLQARIRDKADTIKTFMKVVDTQLQELNPPETKATYDKLIVEGYSDEEVRRILADRIFSELLDKE